MAHGPKTPAYSSILFSDSKVASGEASFAQGKSFQAARNAQKEHEKSTEIQWWFGASINKDKWKISNCRWSAYDF